MELSLGPYRKKSKKASTKDGVTRWYQQFDEELFALPTDEGQIPDAIINIYAKSAVFGNARIGYVRLKASDIMG